MQRRLFLTGAALAGGLAALSRADAADGDARAAVERFAATLTARDLDGFAALFAEDYVNHQNSAAAPAPSGKSATQATVAFFANRVGAMSDLKVDIEAIVASGDMAAASFAYEGTQDGAYYGFPPSDRKLRFTSCDIFKLRDGRIAEHWGMGDIAGVIAQLKRG
jgi:steroid delta-isomerase-like uncharacterized protein